MKKDEIAVFLRRYRELNGAKYSIEKIGFFGSGSRDEMNEKSDIDVVVELTDPDLFNLIGIKQDLETELQCHVDIVRYRKNMNLFLKNRIDKEAVYV